MKSNRTDLSLQSDTRAVSSLIGFILLFGILVIAFVGYQAQVVPQQNAETEFKHFQENQDELIELRSAILTAGTSDRPQFPTVQLGTNYRTRVLAVNGPPPAGFLQTSDSYPINISNSSNGTDNVVIETRFVEYKPGYYEIDVGSTWYENSVLYLNQTESGGGRVVIEDQSLVTDGDTLRITALQNDFQRSGTNRITLELFPTTVEGNISDLPEDQELTVELPTRLGSDYWVGQFNNSSSVAYNKFNGSEFEGANKITLTVDSVDNLELNTVGIGEEPTKGAAKNIDRPDPEPDPDPDPEPDPDPDPPDTVDDFDTGADEYSNGEDVDVSGNVDIRGKDNIGDINAGGYVRLEEKASSGDIDTDGDVTVGEKGKTGDIDTDGDVTVDEKGETGDIDTDGDVTVGEKSKTGDINTDGDVTVDEKGKTGDIDTDGDVTVGEKATTGDITAGGDVIVGEDANTGDIDAEGEITYE